MPTQLVSQVENIQHFTNNDRFVSLLLTVFFPQYFSYIIMTSLLSKSEFYKALKKCWFTVTQPTVKLFLFTTFINPGSHKFKRVMKTYKAQQIDVSASGNAKILSCHEIHKNHIFVKILRNYINRFYSTLQKCHFSLLIFFVIFLFVSFGGKVLWLKKRIFRGHCSKIQSTLLLRPPIHKPF